MIKKYRDRKPFKIKNVKKHGKVRFLAYLCREKTNYRHNTDEKENIIVDGDCTHDSDSPCTEDRLYS